MRYDAEQPVDGATAEGTAFRLSPQQERLWHLARTEGWDGFVTRTQLAISGPVDLVDVESALRSIVERHEILRTRFVRSRPAQVVLGSQAPPFAAHVHESRETEGPPPAPEPGRETPAAQGDGGIDPVRGPVLRATLVTRAPGDHRLTLEATALCADRRGIEAVVEHLCRGVGGCEFREAGNSGPPQYADLAQGQRDLLVDSAGAEGRDFWRRILSRKPAWRMPWHRPPGTAAGFRPHALSRTVSRELVGALDRLADDRRCGTADLLLACWSVLLWRHAGNADGRIGILCEGREHPELESLPGLFAQYVPLPVRLGPGVAYLDAVERLRLAADDAESRRPYFSWDLADTEPNSRSEAEPRRPPILEACFEHTTLPGPLEFGSAVAEVVDHDAVVDAWGIRLACLRRVDQLRLDFGHDPRWIGDEEAAAIMDRFETLLEDALRRPEAPIEELDLLADGERRRLLIDLNDTPSLAQEPECVHEAIDRRASHHPERHAVRADGSELSYGRLQRRADRLARHLRALGLRRGQLVGICIDRSAELVVAVLGVLKAGAAFLPLDPGYPLVRLRFMVKDSGAAWILGRGDFPRRVAAGRARIVDLDEQAAAVDEQAPSRPDVEVGSEDLAYVIYTSGSTGRPKGVMVTHRGLGLSNGARIARYGRPVDRFLLLSSFSFDSSFVGIFWTLGTGGSLDLVDEEVQRDPDLLIDVLLERRISHLLALPSLWNLVLERLASRGTDGMPALSTVIVAGEACPQSLVEMHRRLLPRAQLYSEYGATETTIFSTVQECTSQDRPTVPLGRPVANARIYVLDPWLHPVPTGVPGEVCFGGEAISPGYVNRPRLTAERFVPDPFCSRDGGRLYRSGDLARHLPDGRIEFLGRLDNQVKVRGFRVELEEIEAVLREHPSVREAAVALHRRGGNDAAPDGADGTGSLVAYVVGGSAAASSEELRAFLLDRLPGYMVPSAFVGLEALPTTPAGKVDRRALMASHSGREASGRAVAPPRTRAERILATIWTRVLDVETVGIRDNFFEIGGDSLLSIQVVGQARAAGLWLRPVQLFEHQTIAELAASLESSPGVAEQGPVIGRVPLAPVQRWFCDLSVPEPDHWNMPLFFALPRRVEPHLVQRAAQELARHHDALRLRLWRSPEGWVQRMAEPPAEVPLEVDDLSRLPSKRQDAMLAGRLERWQGTLDLGQGPLSRLVIFDRGDDRPALLLWLIHHLAVDVVSARILEEDLNTALRQLEAGEQVRLPAKTTSFKTWAETLCDRAEDPELEAEGDAWRSELRSGGAPPLDLPGGREANTEASGRVVRHRLSEAHTTGLLKGMASARDADLADGLLSSLAVTLQRWAGRPVSLDLEGHGRVEELGDDLDLSRTVGWFTVTHPVTLQLDEDAEPLALAHTTRARLDAVPSRGLGYGILRYLSESGGAEALRRHRSPEVAFNYLGQLRSPTRPDAVHLVDPDLGYGSDRHPDGMRSHLLEVIARVVDGRLHLSWNYSAAAHLQSTVEALAEEHAGRLVALAEAVDRGPDDSEGAGKGFGWSRDELDAISAAIEGAGGRFEGLP